MLPVLVYIQSGPKKASRLFFIVAAHDFPSNLACSLSTTIKSRLQCAQFCPKTIGLRKGCEQNFQGYRSLWSINCINRIPIKSVGVEPEW